VFVIASMSAPAKTNTTAVMTDLEISNATVADNWNTVHFKIDFSEMNF
jgi:hypothetical protein